MKFNLILYSFFILCLTHTIFAKVSNERIKTWLELGALRQKMDENILKYNNLEAELKEETNQILEQGIYAGDQLAENDPYAALVMYYDLHKLTKKTVQTHLDIKAINKKFQDLSDYITKTIKELEALRSKHLHLP